MELYTTYLWVEIILGILGIILILALLYAIISAIVFVRKMRKKIIKFVENIEETFRKTADRYWFLKLFTSGEK